MNIHVYYHHDEFLLSWLARLESEVKKMATLQDVNDALDKLSSDIAAEVTVVSTKIQALNDSIAALQAQLANGTPITSADLDATKAKADAADAAVKAMIPPDATP